jgi:hypothetical protein
MMHRPSNSYCKLYPHNFPSWGSLQLFATGYGCQLAVQTIQVQPIQFWMLLRGVRSQIGAFAAPDVIHWAPGLPKTRSGKIMRRILRKVASGQTDELGDISTLAEPSIVETLISLRPEKKK